MKGYVPPMQQSQWVSLVMGGSGMWRTRDTSSFHHVTPPSHSAPLVILSRVHKGKTNMEEALKWNTWMN